MSKENGKKYITLKEMVDKYIGERGSVVREEYELEFNIELSLKILKEAKKKLKKGMPIKKLIYDCQAIFKNMNASLAIRER